MQKAALTRSKRNQVCLVCFFYFIFFFLKKELAVRPLRIAVVGVPNVGKSSLVNRILGPNEQRSMVSPIPGTTHDTVDTPVNWRGERELVLLDTAGIDRRAKVRRYDSK